MIRKDWLRFGHVLALSLTSLLFSGCDNEQHWRARAAMGANEEVHLEVTRDEGGALAFSRSPSLPSVSRILLYRGNKLLWVVNVGGRTIENFVYGQVPKFPSDHQIDPKQEFPVGVSPTVLHDGDSLTLKFEYPKDRPPAAPGMQSETWKVKVPRPGDATKGKIVIHE